jgi:hypothetical protein
MKSMLPFLSVLLADYYLLPLLVRNTGVAIMMLLVIIPLICAGCSVVYGIKHSFDMIYVLIAAILFIPSIYIFYNSTAWFYVLAYSVVALIGNLVGAAFHMKKAKHLTIERGK